MSGNWTTSVSRAATGGVTGGLSSETGKQTAASSAQPNNTPKPQSGPTGGFFGTSSFTGAKKLTGKEGEEWAAPQRLSPRPKLESTKRAPWKDLKARNTVGPVPAAEILKADGPLAPSTDFPDRHKDTAKVLEQLKLASLVDNSTWVHDIRGLAEAECAKCQSGEGHEVVGNAAQTMVLPAGNLEVDAYKHEFIRSDAKPKIMILPDMKEGDLIHLTIAGNVSGHEGETKAREFGRGLSSDGVVVGVQWLDDAGKVLSEREATLRPVKEQGEHYATQDPADKDPSVHYAVAQDVSIPVRHEIDGKKVARMELYSYPVGSAKQHGYKHHRVYETYFASNAPSVDSLSKKEEQQLRGVAQGLNGRSMRDGVEGY